MQLRTAAFLFFLCAGPIHPAVTGDEWLHRSREPLVDRKGNIAFEGRRILLASDAYPRPAARFAEEPRAERDGGYADMVYPSNPDTLAAMGKTIDDVWPFVARFDGLAVPHRPRSWPSFAPYSSDWRIPYPMRIAADGTVYFAESTTGFPRWSANGELFRVFTTHVDRFWFLEMMPLMWSMGPFAIDGDGFGYIVTSTADRCTGTYPPSHESTRGCRLSASPVRR